MMKHLPLWFNLLLLVGLISNASGQSVVAEWDPSLGMNADGGVRIPSSVGGVELKGSGGGTEIGKAKEPYDGSAIIFNGTQAEPVRTALGKQYGFGKGDGIEIDFLVEGGEGESTILSMADLEIRYVPAEGNVQVILYFDPQGEGPGYKILRHALAPGNWAKLNVALLGNDFTVNMNGVTRKALITNPLREKPSSLMLGARIVNNASARTLKGQIGKVRLSRN